MNYRRVKIMNEKTNVPKYYDLDFKGRKPKYCPTCNSKMKYDGYGSDDIKIDEYWYCKKCDKLIKNPD